AEISGHAYYRANKYETNLLSSTNDPRLSRIFAAGASAGTTINGNVLGNDATNVTNATAGTFGPGILIAPTMPAVLLSGAEGCFLLSEGVLDGIVAGTTASVPSPATAVGAQYYYEHGINASFAALGVPSASAAALTYYTQSLANINWNFSNGSFAAEQQAIIVQKYIALSHYGWFEIYNEFRRTGYPNNLPRSTAAGALGTGPVPNRIYYPSTEFTNNAANVPTNIDAFTSKIFWAQ
uniref:SusD/RagB family nutrient-binding outer membrane lipoprotein n=1 Tax=uncultured Mucilaginibacter sp. TaxID=797541 RepID=UPI0025E009EA